MNENFVFCFKDQLEILEEYAEYRNSESDSSRALAFRRGICVLMSLNERVRSVQQLKNIKNIGEHTRNVIQVVESKYFGKVLVFYFFLKEILDYGYCKEVESIKLQDYYQTMKVSC